MKLPSVAVLVVAAGFLLSCSTLSEAAREANVHPTTSTLVVKGRSFVEDWTAAYECVYSARDVATLVANQLAAQGRHDIWVLVEYVSPGKPVSVHLDVGRLDTWRISVYR